MAPVHVEQELQKSGLIMEPFDINDNKKRRLEDSTIGEELWAILTMEADEDSILQKLEELWQSRNISINSVPTKRLPGLFRNNAYYTPLGHACKIRKTADQKYVVRDSQNI